MRAMLMSFASYHLWLHWREPALFLTRVEERWIHTPWEMDRSAQRRSGCLIGRDYPAPVVDHVTAARTARQRMGSLRRGDARAEGQKILQRHGSRRGGSRPRSVVKRAVRNP